MMTRSALQIPDDAVCLHCGYALRGLVEMRCPECGEQFDPAIPSTIRRAYRRPDVKRWAKFQLLSFVAGSPRFGPVTLWLAVLLLITPMSYVRANDIGSLLSPYIAFLWIVIPVRLVLGTIRPNERSPTLFWKTPTLCILLFLFVLPIFPWRRECQHGKVWMIGRIGIAHSEVDRPCPYTMPDRFAMPIGGHWFVVFNPDPRATALRWQ